MQTLQRMLFNGFTQCVTSPTRSSYILQLVFVSDPLLISTIDVVPPFSTSDHNAIKFELVYSKSVYSAKTHYSKQFSWKYGDYDGLCEYFACYNWNDLFMYCLTPDSLWSAFRKVWDQAIDLFVPYKYVCCDSIVRPYRFKYPRQIRELKRCLWRDPCNAFMPSTIRILLKSKECKVALHDYELRMEKNVIDAGNSGKFLPRDAL